MDTNVAIPTTDAARGPSLASLFLVFLKLGSFAFGGVYGMLSFFEKELVDRRGWIGADELAEGVALGQMRRDAAPVAAALRGLKPAVAGMLLAVTVQLAGASLVHHPVAAGLGVASFVAMAFTKLDPTLVVVAAGLVGAALL